ncbi:PAS domain S-box protein [Flavobacterium sp. GT3R68]|uniref:PAS domain S-box protein n=1 Tax=Flavobacterium sp. GT3R68 TaxID=2594437 RepID=UPI000F85F242|nr:PAS domain S-box protein [Flavobacterium sp. GT3R68]RTY90633.1 PAS domain S-box protein [Flavobacterium sp. GSN2]TRW89841.1 PAS domain S-box protein [Flavobacterium sp. GT3R68]
MALKRSVSLSLSYKIMESKKKLSKAFDWFFKRPRYSGFLVFLILCLVGVFIVYQRYHIVKENEKREMSNILTVVEQNIDQSLKNCYTTTLTLALTLNDKGVPEDFNHIGAKLVASNPTIKAVQLVPNGVISYIYPMEGNEAAMGLNILKSPILKVEALRSVKNQKMYFAGPFELKQGGLGIVGRLPVYKNNRFWGFSAVVIKLDEFLDSAGIKSIDQSKYYFQFSKQNPVTGEEEFFLPDKRDFTGKYFISTHIPDGDWKLYLIIKKAYTLHLFMLIPAILSLVIAILLGVFTTTLLRKPAELQRLIHNQASKLLNSEIKFKTIFDQAAVGIGHVDTETGVFIEINKQYCKLLGYSQEEMKEKNFQSITYADDLDEDLGFMEDLKAGKIREFSMEKRYVTKNGEIIWVNLFVSPLWKINETPTTHISIVEDITLRKQAEDLIKKSEVRFKSLFDDSPIPLWEQDFSEVKKYLDELNLMGKDPKVVANYLYEHPEVVSNCISLVNVIDVNYECLRLHKIGSKNELTKSLSALLDKDSATDFVKILMAICKGEKKFIMDSRVKTAEGQYRDIDLRWNVIRGYEETLERIIVSTEDITVRKINEKIILNSQNKIRDLVNSIDGIVWECNYYTLELTFISKKVEDILGYTPSEWMSDINFWENHIHPDDKEAVVTAFRNIVNDNEHEDSEYRMITKDGNIVWVREIINVVFENNRPVSLRGIMIDITKTKEAEKDLNNSFYLVTEQNKRLLNFSYIVSHNLRSHTSNIESIIDLIEGSESEEETLQMIKLLKTVSVSLNETMNNLNEVVNIQTNISLISETVHLKSYIEKIKNILSEQIALKDVTIITNVDDEDTLTYNAAYLESILLNLISNAIRYSSPDRKPVIEIKWYKKNEGHILEVSDNGIGIDMKKNADKIFGMYKTFSDHPDSRGIGLFITKNQIDAMGGNISVKSEVNAGTTFKIYIR